MHTISQNLPITRAVYGQRDEKPERVSRPWISQNSRIMDRVPLATALQLKALANGGSL